MRWLSAVLPRRGCLESPESGAQVPAWLRDDGPYDLEPVRNFPEPRQKKKSFMHSVSIKGQHVARPWGNRDEDDHPCPGRALRLAGETAGLS